MKRLFCLFFCAAWLFCGCSKTPGGDLLAFFHQSGTHTCRFIKEDVTYRAKVEVKNEGSEVLVSFSEPQSLEGVCIKKTADDCIAEIGGKAFSGAAALFAPFGIFDAKEAALVNTELKDGKKTVTVCCDQSEYYTITYGEGDTPLSVEGGGYLLSFEGEMP